jgi:hypothetical protein
MDGIHLLRGRMHVSMDGIHTFMVGVRGHSTEIYALGRGMHASGRDASAGVAAQPCEGATARRLRRGFLTGER